MTQNARRAIRRLANKARLHLTLQGDHMPFALPELPSRIARLPIDHRGFPVPWFVAWIDGKPDHRVADMAKFWPAINESRCWICGDRLGRNKAFLLGPMCAITRTVGEPPAHRDCAEFAARACPFMAIPEKRRRESGLPTDASMSDNGSRRNPGAMLLWITNDFHILHDPGGKGYLFRIAAPTSLTGFYEGRPATRAEVMASLEGGLALLQAQADAEGPAARVHLSTLTRKAVELIEQSFPAETTGLS